MAFAFSMIASNSPFATFSFSSLMRYASRYRLVLTSSIKLLFPNRPTLLSLFSPPPSSSFRSSVLALSSLVMSLSKSSGDTTSSTKLPSSSRLLSESPVGVNASPLPSYYS